MNKPSADLGDLPAEEFRQHLHAVADWIADYREKIAEYRISPAEKPGPRYAPCMPSSSLLTWRGRSRKP